jgi:hypothetical protein
METQEKFKKEFGELFEWITFSLEEDSFFEMIEDLEIEDDEDELSVNFIFRTNNFLYEIYCIKPSEDNEDGYLSCAIAEVENKNTFYDLSDGNYTYETWIEILKWFFAYEIGHALR